MQGLLAKDSRLIDVTLRGVRGYLGALRCSRARCAWLFYDSRLPPMYRVVGDQLRLMYREYEVAVEEDNRDFQQFEAWRERGTFSRLNGRILASGIVFDPYDNQEYARTLGESEEFVRDQFSKMLDDILLGIAKIDPRLVRNLHGALKAFDGWANSDSSAQVAVSSRRFLERLADALYPPRSDLVDGRKVGKAEYRNRLWAFIRSSVDSRSQQEIMLSTLSDVGARVDALDAVANKGIHADLGVGETQRLLMALMSLVYRSTDNRPTTP